MSEREKVQIEIEVAEKALKVEHLTCPNGHLLSDEHIKFQGNPAIKLRVRFDDQEGLIFLDPVFGSYNKIEEGVKIPKNKVVDFFCPECDVNLKDEHETCQTCSSPLFVLHLPKGSIVEGCTKKGCQFHKIKIVDAEQQLSRLFENNTLQAYL